VAPLSKLELRKTHNDEYFSTVVTCVIFHKSDADECV